MKCFYLKGRNWSVPRVIGQSKDSDGQIVGTYDKKSFNNTMVYDVEFPNGDIKEYVANVIAKHMYA